MTKMGLPKQFAKMGFKKGWAAFKKFKGSKGAFNTKKITVKKKVSTTKKPIVHSAKKGASPMAESKKMVALKSRLSGALKKARVGVHSPGEAALAIGEGLGGAIATSYAIGAIPTGSLPRPGAIKSIAQIVLGGFLATRKNKHLKYVGFGTAIIGGVSLAREFLPVPTFAGEVDSALYGEEFMGDEFIGDPMGEEFMGDNFMGDPMMGQGEYMGQETSSPY